MNKKFIVKTNTHIVIKRDDVLTLITADEALQLANIMQKIEDKRYELGKKIRQSYLVINIDEPYADEIREVIKRGEESKAFEQEYEEMKKKHDELDKKEKPMKPSNIEIVDNEALAGICKCGREIYPFENYCASCGQHIDWGNE